MNPTLLLQLDMQKKSINHALHIVLSGITGLLWLPVYLIIILSVYFHNRKIEKRIERMMINQAFLDEKAEKERVL